MRLRVRGIGLALGFFLPALPWLLLRSRETPVRGSQNGTRSIMITNDNSTILHCALVREVTFSGEVGANSDLLSESDRDSNLKVIAADAGGNVVLVLERARGFIRGRIYRCADPKP
jgi:hypothetical protein